MADIQAVWDQIVSTATIKRNHGRLFCLGPNVGRISFASQQMRALNLIWALKKANHIKANDRVAIVGAGISGVTAAFAVRAMGCSVKLIERGEQPLYKQRSTTHRHVHPSINWWPTAELSPTTSLPFLNWHLGQCNMVMELLEKEWKKLRAESGSFVEFYPNENAFEIASKPADDGRLVLKTDKQEIDGLDAVIVACGFGDEVGIEKHKAKSYWRADELENERSEPNGPSRFVVSGTGDGGLIDALRIAYEFSFGKLAFRIAETVSGTDLALRLSDIEARSEQPSQADYYALAKDIDNDDEFGAVYGAVKKLLNETLRKGRTRYVILVDRNKPNPFARGPAPIHRLLVAYAMWHGIIDFVTGEVKVGDDEISVDTEIFKRSATALIVRHGAKPFHDTDLIKPHEWTVLESNQKLSIDYSYKQAWGNEPYPVPSSWNCPVLNPQEFTKAIQKLAKDTFREIGSNGHITTRADKFLVYFHDIEYRPQHLFGRDVIYQSEGDVETVYALV